MQTILTNNFMEEAIKGKLYSNKANLKFHLDYLFQKVDFANLKVLDVGGGKGLLTFYAATKGAKSVICLEPECDGSSMGMNKEFNDIKFNISSTMPVELLPVTLQDYMTTVNKNEFDIIVMHNSINHLNEDACINLLKNKKCYQIYHEIFSKVYDIMKGGGQLIIADCSNRNLLNDMGIKNFLVPTIEWQKHQMPKTWISLLKEIGFKKPQLEWKSPNSFGRMGKVLMSNSFVSYITTSNFKFTMEK